MYPCRIPPYTRSAAASAAAAVAGVNVGAEDPMMHVSLETKRRRWGRFIGLRGCESPTEEEGEGLVERMEREWRAAMERAREEEVGREKGWRGRW
jgi:hypothetical protein